MHKSHASMKKKARKWSWILCTPMAFISICPCASHMQICCRKRKEFRVSQHAHFGRQWAELESQNYRWLSIYIWLYTLHSAHVCVNKWYNYLTMLKATRHKFSVPSFYYKNEKDKAHFACHVWITAPILFGGSDKRHVGSRETARTGDGYEERMKQFSLTELAMHSNFQKMATLPDQRVVDK